MIFLSGKNINLRTVNISDAEFVFQMRHDEVKTKYLSKIKGTLESQKNWILDYLKREQEYKEYYFVIESKDQEPLGLVRMYDFQEKSFCWGSWIIKANAPQSTAIESALQIYEFSFYQLNFLQSHFDVRKNNSKVVAFHQRFGAHIIKENELDYFFVYLREDYEKIKNKYKKFLK